MADREPELDELRALAGRVGIGPDERLEPLLEPPADLWDRIAREAGVTGGGPGGRPEERATVVPIASRRRPSWLLPAIAAAAAAVVVAGVAVAGDDESEVLASAELDRLGPSGAGSAELVEVDGSLRLRVDTSDLDAGDGFLELWVIDTEVQRLVSLGPLRPDGIYDLPAGLDPRAFPVVDVSVEPIDGDPTHSGDSVLRGQLEF
jgi:anti-sigma-K factor RskA